MYNTAQIPPQPIVGLLVGTSTGTLQAALVDTRGRETTAITTTTTTRQNRSVDVAGIEIFRTMRAGT